MNTWDAFWTATAAFFIELFLGMCVILLGIAYLLSPLDLIPDPIPVAGILDDLGVLGLVLRYLIKAILQKAFWQFLMTAGLVALSGFALSAVGVPGAGTAATCVFLTIWLVARIGRNLTRGE